MNEPPNEVLESGVPRQQRQSPLLLVLIASMGVVLLILGLFAHYPGSIPHGWQRTNGIISTVYGNTDHGPKHYQPVVRYLALGYLYEVKSHRSFSSFPDLGGTASVAYDPQEPQHAAIVDEAPTNYLVYFLPIGALLLTVSVYTYIRKFVKEPRKLESERLHLLGQKRVSLSMLHADEMGSSEDGTATDTAETEAVAESVPAKKAAKKVSPSKAKAKKPKAAAKKTAVKKVVSSAKPTKTKAKKTPAKKVALSSKTPKTAPKKSADKAIGKVAPNKTAAKATKNKK